MASARSIPGWLVGAVAVAVVAVQVVTPASALAAQAGKPSREDESRALQLFERSEVKYREGRFEEAIELLREAYQLKPEPVLLYNIGRAHEGLGDRARAVEFFERYLREEPQVQDRAGIERRVASLRRQMEEDRGRAAASAVPALPVTTPAGTATVPLPGPPAPELPRRSASVVPWIVAGAGVGLLGVGAAFGGRARSLHAQAVDEPVQQVAVARQHDASAWVGRANAFLVAGAAVGAVGLAWGVIDVVRSRGGRSVELALGPGGMVVRGRWP